MNAGNCTESQWEELLERIENRTIIPVIGQGLYWVKDEQGKDVLLYDHLAEKLAETVGYTLPQESHHKFAKAALQFLREKKKESYTFLKAIKELKNIFQDVLEKVKLPWDNPLSKVARIRAFNLFINTTYEDYLVNMLEIVRNHECKLLNYTLKDKKLRHLKDELFDKVEESKTTLVYNIYGNLLERVEPAFTEKDILETIISFNKNMQGNPDNPLSPMLENSSLLFIGCGYNDWLFRFFIRSISNQPFKSLSSHDDDIPRNFVSDAFESSDELPEFLKCYDSKVFYSRKGKGKEFVDTLFEKLKQHYPGEIIPVSEYPETAFISFPRENRAVAVKLESQLRDDGIKVWVDKNEVELGDEIDSIIESAITRCPVFIPLISKESKNFHHDNGKERYHYQEWKWALNTDKNEGNPPKIIIPVIIDNTDWIFEGFKKFLRCEIPGGVGGQYEELKNRLLKLQMSSRGLNE